MFGLYCVGDAVDNGTVKTLLAQQLVEGVAIWISGSLEERRGQIIQVPNETPTEFRVHCVRASIASRHVSFAF